jgi:SAM-dependent methyltransferase
MADKTSNVVGEPSLGMYHFKRTTSKVFLKLTKEFPLKMRHYMGGKRSGFEARRFQEGEEVHFVLGGHRMRLTPTDFGGMLDEWRIWNECYLPSFPLAGKTVLDVGAGPGETALFYLLHGASKVICVEPHGGPRAYLANNAAANGWNVDILDEPFTADMLSQLRFDFIKMDSEGGEVELLNADAPLPFPAVVCLHYYNSDPAMRRLRDRFALRKVYEVDGCETIWKNW